MHGARISFLPRRSTRCSMASEPTAPTSSLVLDQKGVGDGIYFFTFLSKK